MQKDKRQPELADIFRKYGEDYRRNHCLSTEQYIIFKYVVPLYLVGIAKLVTIAVLNRIPTTPAGTGTARNARHLLRKNGSIQGSQSCSRVHISTTFLHCLMNSTLSF